MNYFNNVRCINYDKSNLKSIDRNFRDIMSEKKQIKKYEKPMWDYITFSLLFLTSHKSITDIEFFLSISELYINSFFYRCEIRFIANKNFF